jgi:hypothetical protein
LTAVNAAADVATVVAIPTAAKQPQASTPTELPVVVRNAWRRPPRAALRTTSAVAAPGVIVSSAATGANVSNTRNIHSSSSIRTSHDA